MCEMKPVIFSDFLDFWWAFFENERAGVDFQPASTRMTAKRRRAFASNPEMLQRRAQKCG